MLEPGFVSAGWPAPANVRAVTTTRTGGASTGAWHSLNLSDRVGDDPVAVAVNRTRLRRALFLPDEPCWLHQVHGARVVDAASVHAGVRADASYSRRSGVVCAVLTADCLPVLLCDCGGNVAAAVHAGWRSLAAGILAKTVVAMGVPPSGCLAWLGPAIGPAAFEVGPEVRSAFADADSEQAAAFAPATGDRWHADLYALARRQLARAGVAAVYGGGRCTASEPETFYSYRRDGDCGRMASLIWFADKRGDSDG